MPRAASQTAAVASSAATSMFGAVVLDRLEGSDRPAELHPLLGVGHGGVGARSHDAHGLRRAERAG